MPQALDGVVRTVTSTNGAMKIRYRVRAFQTRELMSAS